MRQQGLRTADATEERGQPVGRDPASVRLLDEDMCRDLLDLPADILQLVGQTVDDGIQQIVGRRQRVLNQRRILVGVLLEYPHRFWSHISHGYQPIARKDEADRIAPGMRVLYAVERSQSHVE